MIVQVIVQGGPPNTSTYYHVAYTWVAVVYVGYVALLWSRARRVRRQLRAAGEEQLRASRAT